MLAAFRDLTLPQFAVMTVFGVLAWLASGLLFTALVHELSPLRGTASYLILGGIGASVPLGPWNMGVLWVVVRGWGVPNHSATSGIALYGVINILGRLALPMLALVLGAATVLIAFAYWRSTFAHPRLLEPIAVLVRGGHERTSGRRGT